MKKALTWGVWALLVLALIVVAHDVMAFLSPAQQGDPVILDHPH